VQPADTTLPSASYQADARWHQLPEGWDLVETAAVAVDSRDRVYVFNRGEHPVIVFDSAGRFLHSWGEGLFVRPHGIHIGPDDSIYLTDDLDHTVRQFTPEGELLMSLGVSGQPSGTGVVENDYRTIRRAGPPFNQPTNLALAADGTMFVTDGYGNARVHVFSPEGELIRSWGEPGDGPGQFNLPHGIAVDEEGILYVADRENSRVQLFGREGNYLSEWPAERPVEVFVDAAGKVYVAELGWRSGLFPDMTPRSDVGGRISVFDREGRVIERWGGGENPCAPGDFYAPHDIWADRFGDIYVSEVTWSAGGRQGKVPRHCHSLQKFTRRGG